MSGILSSEMYNKAGCVLLVLLLGIWHIPVGHASIDNHNFSVLQVDRKIDQTSSPFVFGTFLGGIGYDQGLSITSDSNGMIYVTGEASRFFPLSDDFAHLPDEPAGGFISAFYPNGSLLWSRTMFARGYAMVLENDTLYVTGFADDSEFPGIQTNLEPNDAYLASYTTSGELLWMTRFGGVGGDYPYDLVVGDEFIAVVGNTESPDYPVINPYQSGNRGERDVFVSYFSLTGTMTWSTLIGGTGEEWGMAVDMDSDGQVCMAGISSSDNFPLINPSIPVTLGSAITYENGFREIISCFSSEGSIEWSDAFTTESHWNDGPDIIFDDEGNLYEIGIGLITKFSQSREVLWSTYSTFELGGEARSALLDENGNIYIAGSTSADDFEAKNGFEEGPMAEKNAFISSFTRTGNFRGSSIFGGSDWDVINDIALDHNGNILVTGYTHSGDLPMVNAFDDTMSDQDAFVHRLEIQHYIDIISPVPGSYDRGELHLVYYAPVSPANVYLDEQPTDLKSGDTITEELEKGEHRIDIQCQVDEKMIEAGVVFSVVEAIPAFLIDDVVLVNLTIAAIATIILSSAYRYWKRRRRKSIDEEYIDDDIEYE